jgi:hypothetical protein
MKQPWQVKAVYILPVAVLVVGVISHTSHDVLKRLVTRFTAHDHTEICSLQYMQHREFLRQHSSSVGDTHTYLHVCYSLSRPQGHSVAGRIMSMKNSNDTIRNLSCDLPVCSTVPQPLRHRVPP